MNRCKRLSHEPTRHRSDDQGNVLNGIVPNSVRVTRDDAVSVHEGSSVDGRSSGRRGDGHLRQMDDIVCLI